MSATETPDQSQFVYFADPMCSWCWGFAPVIRAIGETYGERLPIRLILGGLRPGTSEPMNDLGKHTIRKHWEHVRDAAGQPFDFAFFDRERFVYDTEPACRAVVAARRLAPESALGFLDHVHRGFYAENRDVTDPDVLTGLAEAFGLDGAQFRDAFDSDGTRAETLRDFQISRNTGVTGYPTLLAGDPETGYTAITVGFQPWPQIEGSIEAWLAQRTTPAPA